MSELFRCRIVAFWSCKQQQCMCLFVLHISPHIRTSSRVKNRFSSTVTPRRRLCLGINLVYSFYCLTCFFLIIGRLCAFLVNVKSKVCEHSYLQPRSWLRSICDLLPWPRELAGISTTGLTLDYSSSAFSISSNSLSSCFLPDFVSSARCLRRLFFFTPTAKICTLVSSPRGWRTINSPLSSASWRGRGCCDAVIVHLMSVLEEQAAHHSSSATFNISLTLTDRLSRNGNLLKLWNPPHTPCF